MSSGRTPNMVWNRVDQEPDDFKIAFFDHSIDHEKRFQMKTACGQNKKKNQFAEDAITIHFSIYCLLQKLFMLQDSVIAAKIEPIR